MLNEICFVVGKKKKSDGDGLKLANDTSGSEVSNQLRNTTKQQQQKVHQQTNNSNKCI